MGDDGEGSEFVIDSRSPYFLHPSDASSAIITTIRLNGRNFNTWEKAVITALTVKNKIALVDGTITKPDPKGECNPAQINAWIIVNSMVTSLILNVIEPRLHASIAYADSAQAIWENIQKRYSVPNVPKIHQLKVEIASCKQGTLDMVEFFNKLMGLWNEFDSCIKRQTCTFKAVDAYLSLIHI